MRDLSLLCRSSAELATPAVFACREDHDDMAYDVNVRR